MRGRMGERRKEQQSSGRVIEYHSLEALEVEPKVWAYYAQK